MYSSKPAFVYGFHGLDKIIAYKILNQETHFRPSHNNFDWLGRGVYFWENNYERAKQYAIEDSQRPKTKIKDPFVLGSIIDLGHCFDLLDQKYLDFLKFAYEEFKKSIEETGYPMPHNAPFGSNDFDFKKRELDCAVIRFAHQLAESEGEKFDSVRAAFWEGNPLYEGAGFRSANHIQLAILNPNCIKGVFLPREKSSYT